MRLGILEDSGVERLEPIALTRPAWALRCGASLLWERQQHALGAHEVGAWVRAPLAELTQLEFPNITINDPVWQPDVWVNARWLPPVAPRLDRTRPHVGLVGQSVAYVVAPAGAGPEHPAFVDEWLERCRRHLPSTQADGTMIDYLWDAVDRNGDMLCQDWEHWQDLYSSSNDSGIAVVGPRERLVIAPEASIEPYVTADTRGGPVLIDKGAVIHSFTRLEGPCHIGQDAWVLGAKIRGGTSIGPRCRVGGEVEASIMLANSNKYHEGFLGHSYVGAWVNLAAATQTSDLRNDYGMVRVTINGQRLPTGRTKIGSYIGDHTKTGLAALLNTGSVIGAFCSVLPSGSLLPQVIPSFCQSQYGTLQERFDLRQQFASAATVMKRRGVDFTEDHRDFFISLYDQTADVRRKTLRESEMRRLKRSV
jgi:UDP-N-acetylglucosamine diphosphorylase/glucosamine-1-phosphate N-acetyltransferase